MALNEEDFKEKLDQVHAWPSLYVFKFIVPSGKEGEVSSLFPRNEVIVRPSSKGKYQSVTIKAMMPSSQSVIDIYHQAAKIEGIISL